MNKRQRNKQAKKKRIQREEFRKGLVSAEVAHYCYMDMLMGKVAEGIIKSVNERVIDRG